MASSSGKYDEKAFVPERDDEAMIDDTDYRYVKSFQQYVCEIKAEYNIGKLYPWNYIFH